LSAAGVVSQGLAEVASKSPFVIESGAMVCLPG
jgi:hypothetical protein